MDPIKTGYPSEFIYGAPPGYEDEIGGLPCTREQTHIGGTAIFSVWAPTPEEREAIAEGANIRLGIWGMEPIPPVSLAITHAGSVKPAEGEKAEFPENFE